MFRIFLVLLVGLPHLPLLPAQSPLQVDPPPRFPREGIPPMQKFARLDSIYKLHDAYLPSHYDLELRVLLDNDPEVGEQFTVQGKVDITFRVANQTNLVKIHVNFPHLDDTSIKITNLNDTDEVIRLSNTSYSHDDTHFVHLILESPLFPTPTYQLHADFISPINTQSLDGLYLSNYTDTDGTVKRVAATQFQAYHARQLFPCFDEPGLRSTFQLNIIRKGNYSTLSNTHLVSSESSTPSGWVKDTFAITPPMPTYLVAFVISDFSWSQAEDALFKGVVRTYAPPPVIARGGGNYSADIAARLLNFFDTYFKTEYPLSKMDSVHLPHFDAGAMENWGLNTYREVYLIYYPGEHLESYRNLLTSVVSHELAHQNFGNRVTCAWWDELWLNEGFATYVSYLGMDAVRPEFRAREWILNDAFQYSMMVDASPSSSHPIVNDAESPSEIDGYFTGITYEKGGSINRMTEAFLTEPTYQKGLQYYLANKSMSSVVSSDLFHYLDVAAAEDARLPPNLTVHSILTSWTKQSSHPLVRVSVGGPSSVFISQERYAAPGSSSTLWHLPITISTQEAPHLPHLIPEIWMDEATPLLRHPHNTSTWIMINVNATGYYRVLYDPHLTSLIQLQLEEEPSLIPPLSRSQLLDDYFNLGYRAFVGMEEVLGLTRYLGEETHFTVWEVVFSHLRRIYNYIQEDEELNSFSNYLLPKVSKALGALGLEQDNTRHVGADGILRSKLMDWAAGLGDEDVVVYATKLWEEWAQDPSRTIPLDIQGSVFCAIAATGGRAGWGFILDKYGREEGPGVKGRLLNALACTKDPSTIDELLGYTVGESPIQPGSRITLIQRVIMNPKGRAQAFKFLEGNVQRIIEEAAGVDPVRLLFSTFATYSSTQEELDKLLGFVVDNSGLLEEIRGSLNSYLNTIRGNIVWKNQVGRVMLKWMGENEEEQPSTSSGPPTGGSSSSSTEQSTPPTSTTGNDDSGASTPTTSKCLLTFFIAILTLRSSHE